MKGSAIFIFVSFYAIVHYLVVVRFLYSLKQNTNQGRSIKLYTNYPIQDEESFDRLGYTELEWEYEGSHINDDTSKFSKILLAQGGSFHYYIAESR